MLLLSRAFFPSEFEKMKNSEYVVSSELAVKVLSRSTVVIALLPSSTFCTLPTDDENINDGKKMKQKPTENGHFAIDDEVYEEIMNYLRSKLMLKCRYIMSNDEKNISDSKEKDM